MGNMYVNFSVKGTGQQQVADTLARAGRRAIVTPSQDGYVVVYDEEADRQVTRQILTVGCLISRELGYPVLAILNHDEDILCYWLFHGGECVDAYNSDPDLFKEDKGAPPWQDGNPARLCAILEVGSVVSVEVVLRAHYMFATDRHRQLVQALGLPAWSFGYGYGYVVRGELDASHLIFVG